MQQALPPQLVIVVITCSLLPANAPLLAVAVTGLSANARYSLGIFQPSSERQPSS